MNRVTVEANIIVSSTTFKYKDGSELYRTQKEYPTKKKIHRKNRFLRILIGPIGMDRKLSVNS